MINTLNGLGLITDYEKKYIIAPELIEVLKETTLKEPRDSGELYRLIREEIIKELKCII